MSGPAAAKTFGRILADLAMQVPEQKAFVFLPGGDRPEEAVTYAELYAKAAAVGQRVRELAGPEQTVLLLLPPGLEYVAALLGCFHAGVIGVSAAPPHPKRLHRTLPRLLGIAEDAEVSCVLTTVAIEQVALPFLSGEHPLARARWLAVDEVSPDPEAPGPSAGGDVAFLQYTSGSTADPRGVMLTQECLLSNCEFISRVFDIKEHTPEECGFSWLPPYHDMGLIGGILQPLYVSGLSVMTSPLTVMKRPLFWLECISRYGAKVSGGPNFAYDLCVRRLREQPPAEPLDLSTWKVAFNGAEPIRAESLDAFVTTFAGAGFERSALLPCYGLAEATLMVTATASDEEPSIFAASPSALEQGQLLAPDEGEDPVRLVGCGAPAPDHGIAIVDERSGRRSPPGQVGEIWVSGPSVADGYWRRPEQSAEAFSVQLEGEGDTPFLRSGDLGAIVDEQLYVVGRIKDLIIVNGRNIHPHDLELVAEQAHPLLRPHCGAAFGAGEEGLTELNLVLEIDPGEADPAVIARLVRRCVAQELELQLGAIALCPPGAVPKTTSGKVQRRLCGSLLAGGELEVQYLWRRDGVG